MGQHTTPSHIWKPNWSPSSSELLQMVRRLGKWLGPQLLSTILKGGVVFPRSRYPQMDQPLLLVPAHFIRFLDECECTNRRHRQRIGYRWDPHFSGTRQSPALVDRSTFRQMEGFLSWARVMSMPRVSTSASTSLLLLSNGIQWDRWFLFRRRISLSVRRLSFPPVELSLL